MRRYRIVISVTLVTLSLFFYSLLACGVKAPPSLPTHEFLFKVDVLRSEWKDGDLYLSGSINDMKGSDDKLDLVKGCKLYYATYSSKAQPCTGCPIDFHGFYEFWREVISSEGLTLNVPKKAIGQVSFFKVHLIGPKGAVGPSSNTVRIDTEQD